MYVTRSAIYWCNYSGQHLVQTMVDNTTHTVIDTIIYTIVAPLDNTTYGKLLVSFAEYGLFYRALLQKKPII